MHGGSLLSFGGVPHVPLSFLAHADLPGQATLYFLSSVCKAAEATGRDHQERMKVPGSWLGIEGRTSCSLFRAGFCKRSWAAFHVGIKGQLFQVSKLCGSKFQAAFRLPKHFQVPAVSFDSFLPGDPRDTKQYETARFPMFWDYIPQDESPAKVCPGPVSAPPNPASLCNSCSD